jgi:hypothetical protein
MNEKEPTSAAHATTGKIKRSESETSSVKLDAQQKASHSGFTEWMLLKRRASLSDVGSEDPKWKPPHLRQPTAFGGWILNLLYFPCFLVWYMFKFVFTLVVNNSFALIQTVLVIGMLSAFAPAFLSILYGEYSSLKKATLAIPGYIVGTAFNTTSTMLMFSYCRFPLSPQWGCPRPPLFRDKVIGGMMKQVGEARDIFQMMANLADRETESVGQGYVQ